MNHSLINANGKTHAKITLAAVAVSLVFVAVVSASGLTRQDAHSYGPVVKAKTTTSMAANNIPQIR